MRSDAEYEEARRWIEWGMNDCAIARLTGIPRRTILDWRASPRSPTRNDGSCPVCSKRALDGETYAYLLGLYLGDGCLSEHPRKVFHLRIVLDKRYPGIIEECRAAIDVVKPHGAAAHVQPREGCVSVGSYWKHWPCLFPQDGDGPKHLRKIELAAWQQQIVSRHPEKLLRGLIQSDGWRGENRVKVRGKHYTYPRYEFVNHSSDIRRIFCLACDEYGVGWRQMKWNAISIARSADVKKLDRVVGAKK